MDDDGTGKICINDGDNGDGSEDDHDGSEDGGSEYDSSRSMTIMIMSMIIITSCNDHDDHN